MHWEWVLWIPFSYVVRFELISRTWLGHPFAFTILALSQTVCIQSRRARERARERERERRFRELMASNNGLLSWLMECFWSAAKSLSRSGRGFQMMIRILPQLEPNLLTRVKLYLCCKWVIKSYPAGSGLDSSWPERVYSRLGISSNLSLTFLPLSN